MCDPAAMLLLLLACVAPVEDSAAPSSGFTAERLEAATRVLTDLGPRASGSPAEVQARDAVVAMLQQAGLAPELAPFTWSPWVRGEASLAIGDQQWPALALSPSPTTTGLRLRLADGASGDLDGAAALFRSSDGSRAEQFASALLGGAAAMIRVTDDLDTDGSPLVEVGHTLWGTSLPSVAVDRTTGDALEAQLGQEVVVDIAAGFLDDHQSHNVLARLPGTTGLRVFVTAHYDSWDVSECAIDNALGVATLVLLAEQAAAAATRSHEVVFLVTAGEEQGVVGALDWVGANEDQLSATTLVLNLDIPWAAEGRYLVAASDDALRAHGIALAQAEGLDPVDAGEPSLSSDHVPFVTRGLPAAWLTRWPDRHYHTHADTADALDYEQALAAARVNLGLLTEAAGLE